VSGLEIRAIAFDVNGTLVDIHTDEGMDQIFRSAAHFLTYQGIDVRRHRVRELYFTLLKQQQRSSAEPFPEYDVVRVWRDLIAELATDYTRTLAADKLNQLPLFLAEMSRGISRRRLRLYPHVRETLDVLRELFPLAIVSDAQAPWARAELHRVGLLDYFDPIVVSGDYGYRKPDRRLFERAIEAMGVPAANTLYIGNDMHRDIFGAGEAGMPTIMFDSNQGTKHYRSCRPDHHMSDYRQLLPLLGLDPSLFSHIT
jgi:putative hydrolase of the HAD superfamily